MFDQAASARGHVVLPHAVRRAAVGCGLWLAMAVVPAGLFAQVAPRHYPAPDYSIGVAEIYSGDYRRATNDFTKGSRGGLKIGTQPWIDASCYQVMAGECSYLMGDNVRAMQYYDGAVRVALAYPTWMMQIDMPPILQPMTRRINPPGWGTSQRNRRLANYSDRVKYAVGQIDHQRQIRQGGVVTPAQYYTVDIQEIVRAAALAMRRRGELLGPLAVGDKLSNEAIAVYSQKQGLVNHWTEVYLDLQLGMAFVGSGKLPQAKTALERAIVAGGEYDHPLTGMVLLELGRIAMAEGQSDRAARYFFEATFPAYDYGDMLTLEEAFRLGAAVHLATHSQGVYPPLVNALSWARSQRMGHVYASLMASAIEAYCNAGDLKNANSLLSEAKTSLKREMAGSRAQARLNYVAALAAFQQGNIPTGNTLLTAALDFQKSGSVWLFQRGAVNDQYRDQRISARIADELFSLVLRDPTATDWMTDPMEAMAAMATPRNALYEAWFDLTLDTRGEPRRAFEIAELAKRGRYLSSLEMGGRLQALRWLVAAPEIELTPQAVLERQALNNNYPKLKELSERVAVARQELGRLPLAPVDQATASRQSAMLAELGKLSAQQEILLREVAMRREACSIVFPPVASLDTLQKSLREREAVLAFYSTGKGVHGFLANNQDFVSWKMPAQGALLGDVTEFLRDLGNFEQNVDLPRDVLVSETWRAHGKDLLSRLMSGSKVVLPYNFQELVIVPDGLLWYVPFEALSCESAAGDELLGTKVRLRYTPLAALAINNKPRAPSGPTAVAVGKLFPNDGAEVAAEAFDDLRRAVAEAAPLPSTAPAPLPLYSTLFHRLIVLADVPAAGALGWQPVPTDRGPEGRLSDWLSLPAGGPEQIILPGYHTAAERSLKGMTVDQAGHELFLTLCALMNNGARTVLISRWRPGGETAFDLVREFAQELPHTSAADAWQRSVILAREHALDPLAEPRVRKGKEPPATTDHPFFWSGYMLVDDGWAPTNESGLPSAPNNATPPAVLNQAAGASVN